MLNMQNHEYKPRLVIEQMLDAHADHILASVTALKEILDNEKNEGTLHIYKEKHLRGKIAAFSKDWREFRDLADRIKKMAKYQGEDTPALLKDIYSVNWKEIREKRKEKNKAKENDERYDSQGNLSQETRHLNRRGF